MSELLQPVPEFAISWADGKLDISSPSYPGYSISANSMGIDIESPFGPVKYRSIQEYREFHAVPRDFPGDKYRHWQVLEAGPGLAELIPEVALTFALKPIAIDPANYLFIIDLTEEARKEADKHGLYLSDARDLIRRAKIITNPKLVRLYNMGLQTAVDAYPELKGCADIVVDFKGAKHYDLSPRVWDIETDYLLKPKPIESLYLPSQRRKKSGLFRHIFQR